MKVAVLSESPADEAAIGILARGINPALTLARSSGHIRARGWPNVLQLLPAAVRHDHYHTDAEALLVVVDADDSVPHDASHAPDPHEECRLCRVRARADLVTEQLSTVPTKRILTCVVGLAVPCIEAWLRCGKDATVGEAPWISQGGRGRAHDRGKALKASVYGTTRPSIDLEVQTAIREATRIVEEGLLPRLETLFPGGFGTLATDLRAL